MNPFDGSKLLGQLPVVTKYLEGDSYAPIQVEIDLTNRCVSACPWCAGYLERHKSQHELDTATALRVVDELEQLGVKSITWTGGGDPTQHRDFRKIVEHVAATTKLQQALITHGVVPVLPVLHCFEWVRFSVDAATVEGYAKQHGRAAHFDKVLENVSDCANAKQGTTIGVGFVTHVETWDEVLAFAAMWRDVPIDYIQFRPLQDTHGQSWETDCQHVAQLVDDARRVDARVVSVAAKYEAIRRGEDGRTGSCYGIFFDTALAADGFVYVCCHHKGNKKYAIGNVEQSSFGEIWAKHLQRRSFEVVSECPSFCRHYASNKLLESVVRERTHPNFI